MRSIDINSDMGESFGAYRLGLDSEVIRHVSSVNIACGFHAGDPRVMNETVRLAAEQGAGVGAHPGFPDLVGFGRRNLDCTPAEVRDDMIYQIAALKGFCTLHGRSMQHVKPHGALYNLCVANEALARAVAAAIAAVDRDLIWVVLGGAAAEPARKVAAEIGIRVVCEGFPDRAYTPEGRLAPRRLPGAVIEEPERAAEQAVRMAKEGRVTALDGTVVELEVQTLCVHGDNPAALRNVQTIRRALEAEGIRIAPFGAASS